MHQSGCHVECEARDVYARNTQSASRTTSRINFAIMISTVSPAVYDRGHRWLPRFEPLSQAVDPSAHDGRRRQAIVSVATRNILAVSPGSLAVATATFTMS